MCDDFYIDMYLNTKLDLILSRDAVTTFFERIQKQFPAMGSFGRCDIDRYSLEDNPNSDKYRWVSLDIERIGAGAMNPSEFEDAYQLQRLVLEISPYMPGISHLDIDSLDLTFAMDFDYYGNHDEVIAEALLGTSAFNCLLEMPNARPIGCSPAVIFGLSNDNRTQARISIESKNSVFEPGKERYKPEEAISLYFTIRRYSGGAEKFDAVRSFEKQRQIAEELMTEKIVPNFVQPLTSLIAQKRII